MCGISSLSGQFLEESFHVVNLVTDILSILEFEHRHFNCVLTYFSFVDDLMTGLGKELNV